MRHKHPHRIADNFLKKYREEKGYTQTKLGFLSNVSHTYISKIETGSIRPWKNVMLKLSNALESDPVDIFPNDWEEDMREEGDLLY